MKKFLAIALALFPSLAFGQTGTGTLGQIPYYQGTNVQGFAKATPGVAGQILTSNGVLTAPSFQVPAALPAITATRFYYVRGVDGNDSFCTGLTNAAYVSGAYPQNCGFKTVQKSATIATTAAIIPNNMQVAVLIQAGTYAECVTVVPWVGGGSIEFDGNNSNPSLTTINCTGSSSADGAFKAVGRMPGRLTIQGVSLSTTTSGTSLYANQGATIFHSNILFGTAVSGQIAADFGGMVIAAGPYTINGGSLFHQHANTGGSVIYNGGYAVTILATPAFSSYFVGVAEGASIYDFATYTGAATGPRCLIHNNGLYENQSTQALVPGNGTCFIDQVSGGVFVGSPELLSFGYRGSTSGQTNVVAAAIATGTLTLPAATDTLVGKATTDILTNKSIAYGQLTGLGTGVSTALGVNVGSAGAPVLFNGALGTPSSGTLTNATGLPLTGLTATAWTTYTPTVTSSGGTLGTYTIGSAAWQQIAKTVIVRVDLTITSAGAAPTGFLQITLPANAINTAAGSASFYDTNSGAFCLGYVTNSGQMAKVTYYSGGACTTNGTHLIGTITYEAA